MSYTPPDGDKVQFPFVSGTYTSPDGNSVRFEFGAVNGTLFAAGFASSTFGTAAVDLKNRTVALTGFDSFASGAATIYNNARLLAPGGISPSATQVSSPTIEFYTRYLLLSGIAPPSITTTHYVAHFIQYIVTVGSQSSAFGTARIEYTERTIEPPFIVGLTFGTTDVRHQYGVLPTSWESSVVSDDLFVDINTRRIYPLTGVTPETTYGVPAVRNQHETLFLTGWQSSEVNFPVIENKNKYLQVAPYAGQVNPEVFGAATIENYDRAIFAFGHQSSRFGISAWVYNNAVPVLPGGLDSLQFGPDTFIAFRVRDVAPVGFDSFYNTHYTVVYNDASVIAPSSLGVSSVFGIPNPVLNLNQTARQFFPYSGESFGTAFVAMAVRTIAPAVFNDVPAGIPDVRFNPYPVAPTGIDSLQFGATEVFERFNYVRPMSTNVHPVPPFGIADIRNHNQVVQVTPSDQASYGIPVVSLYDRYVLPESFLPSVFGAHVIRDRTSRIYPAPVSIPQIVNTHTIRNFIADPPATQRVYPESVFIGLNTNPGIVPSPVVRSMTIAPESFVSFGFGSPTLTRNSIAPDGIGTLEQFGIPVLISSQYCFPSSIPHESVGGDSDRLEFRAKPFVSPYTIYAPSADQATSQAHANHPGEAHIIDFGLGDKMGQPSISNFYRSVTAHGFSNETFGIPAIDLRKRYVYPRQFLSQRFGLTVFLNVPQYVRHEEFGFESSTFGTSTVAPPPYTGPQYVTPAGLSTTGFGQADVASTIRNVYPSSITSDIWGVPLVGYPRTYIFGGLNATLWGTARVEHKIRTVEAQGHDSLTFGPDLGNFDLRMRVRGLNPLYAIPSIPPLNMFGQAMIAQAVRPLSPTGIPPRLFGTPVLSTSAVLAPSGWDSSEFGDVDEWEAGMIKAHGDDMSTVGTPRLQHPLYVGGILSDVFGEPRMARVVYPTGMPPIGFDGPSLTDPFGCSTRVVVPLSILSQENVPSPVIS